MRSKALFPFIFFLFAISHCSVGQIDTINYVFPRPVHKAINDRITFILSKEPNTKFYLILRREVYNHENLGNYFIAIGNYINDHDELPTLMSIINASNRYCQILNIKIPIIFFDYDFPFISYGIDNEGRIVRKNIVGEFFSIEFTSEGKLVKK